MPAFNRFNSWTDTMVETANCGTDQFAIALTNVAPSASNTVLADITQISYTGFGSRNMVTSSSSQTAGNYSLVFASLTLGTTVTSPTFRYVVIYDDTLAGDPLVGWYDIGATTIPANTSLIFSGMGLDLKATFSPTSLFTGGFQGAWYDFSDLSTLFQDSAGTTPVTAVEQPIGRVNDKSGNGNHAIQATSSKKPVLSARKNLLLATTTMSTQNVTTAATPYTLTHTGTGTITLSGTSTAGPLVGAGTLTFTPTAGTLTLTVSGTVTNAQLEYGSTATTYQRVTTATDYDTVGFPHYAKFDGVDDVLASAASINFTATDKMSVFAGGRADSNATISAIADFNGGWANTGSFALASTLSVGVAEAGFRTRGLGISPVVSVPLALYKNAVISGLGDISLDVCKIRVSGVENSSSDDQGAGNYGNAIFRVGASEGYYFHTGQINQLVVVGKTASAGEITSTEQFIASKSGITL